MWVRKVLEVLTSLINLIPPEDDQSVLEHKIALTISSLMDTCEDYLASDDLVEESSDQVVTDEEFYRDHLDSVISDFENKRIDYLQVKDELQYLLQKTSQLGLDDLHDEVQDYSNRVDTDDSLYLHEGSSIPPELAGIKFRGLLSRLGRRKDDILSEYLSPEELRDEVESHNNEIGDLLKYLDPKKDSRFARLSNLIITPTEIDSYDN